MVGQARDYHKKFKFRIEEAGITLGHFRTCSELSAEIDKIEQREGGSLTPNKSLGLVNYTDITLERGAADDDDLWEWWKQCIDAATGLGEVEEKFKRNLDIVQLDRGDNEVRRWNVAGAFPLKFVAGEWDNEASENTMESITLTYDNFDR